MGLTGNFKEFFDDVQQEMKKKLFEPKKKICITAAIQALADLQVMSPVDTGRYRAGHTLTIDKRSDFVPDDISPEEKRKRSISKTNTSMSQYTSQASENAREALSMLNGANIEKVVRMIIYITNNLDYAAFIEDGSYCKDQQAPKAIYAKVRDKTEQRINSMISQG